MTQQEVFNKYPLARRCEVCKHWDGKPPKEEGVQTHGQCTLNGWDIGSHGHCGGWTKK